MSKILLCLAFLLLAFHAGSQTPATEKIFWKGYSPGDLESIKLDGSGRTIEFASENASISLEIDVLSGKVYWIDANTFAIMRSNLDGSGAEAFFTDGYNKQSLSIDFVARKLYWSNISLRTIESINLDGSGQAVLRSAGTGTPVFIKIDNVHRKAYWFDRSAYQIWRINLDGTGEELFVNNIGSVYQLDIDEENGILYFPNFGINVIERINLDGTGRTAIVSGFSNVGWPLAIALDKVNGKVYWWDADLYTLKRANTDGTNVQVVQSDVYSVSAIIVPYILQKAKTKIAVADCGTTLEHLNTDYIAAEPVDGAEQYEFRITNGAYVATATDDLQPGKVRIVQFPGYQYNTTYLVDVRVKTDGTWGEYGNACSITTTSGPHSEIDPSQCGTTLDAVNSTIYATTVNGATGYRFRITNGANVQTIDRSVRTFNLSMLASYEYNTTYTVDVAVEFDGAWSRYSSACNITTPAAALTQLVASQCGVTLATIGTKVNAGNVAGASTYRFRITKGASVQTIDKAIPYFKFTELPAYEFNSTYTVDVSVEFNGFFYAYGPSCAISTPSIPLTQLQASQCGTTLASLNSYIYANSVSGAQGYRFRVKNGADVQYLNSSTRAVNLNMLPGGKWNTTYEIDIAVDMTGGGDYGSYGPVCSVAIPAVLTQLKSSQRNITLAAINKLIYADPVSNASTYRFRITNGSSVQTIDRTTNSFYITQIPEYAYGTTYTIDVATEYYGAWQPYGNAFNVTTPEAAVTLTSLDASSCGIVLTDMAQGLAAKKVANAEKYEFLVKFGSSYSQSVVNNNFLFNMAQLRGLPAGTECIVQVRTFVSNMWSAYGPECTVTTPGTAERMAVTNSKPLLLSTEVTGSRQKNVVNTLNITNILTPNGDGKNDFWIIDGIEQYPNNRVRIATSSGKVVYEKRGYDNSWNATFNGTPLNEGTYYYYIDFGKDKLTRKGFVTVVKEAVR